MADILHDFPIQAPPARVFAAVGTPAGLDAWWTLGARGEPRPGATWELDFGPGFLWRAEVRALRPGEAIEWELTEADGDWTGTRVGFELAPAGAGTAVRFHHTGWRAANPHYRTSSFCWAMYLRLLRKHVEEGEVVPYERRLDV
jgi:uncharacterized protein YndB with AHSA1/START domain